MYSKETVTDKFHVTCPKCSNIHIYLVNVKRTIDTEAFGFGIDFEDCKPFKLTFECPNKRESFSYIIEVVKRAGIEIEEAHLVGVQSEGKEYQDIFELVENLTYDPSACESVYQPWCSEIIRMCIRAYRNGFSKYEQCRNFLETSRFLLKYAGLDKIEPYVAELLDYEIFLMGVDENYRDHVFHTINVFLFGYYIINQKGVFQNYLYSPFANNSMSCTDCNKLFNHYCPESCTNSGTIQSEYYDVVPDRFLRVLYNWNTAWFLASLFHDIGYPVEKFPQIVQITQKICVKFDFMGYKYDINPGEINWKEEISELMDCYNVLNGTKLPQDTLTQLSSSPINAYLQTRYDHGLVGATRILKLLKAIENGEKVWAPYKRAVLAIALHNIAGDDKNNLIINAKKDPLSFLLKICDELQEWGRERPYELDRIELDSLEVGGIEASIIALDVKLNYILSNEAHIEKIRNAKKLISLENSLLKHDFADTFYLRITAFINNKYVLDSIEIPSGGSLIVEASIPISMKKRTMKRIAFLEQLTKEGMSDEIWNEFQKELKNLKDFVREKGWN